MNEKKIMKVFRETAYVRMGGSAEEKKAAEYLIARCADLGLAARMEEFSVDMATIGQAILTVDGKQIPCKGYLCAGSAQVYSSQIAHISSSVSFKYAGVSG